MLERFLKAVESIANSLSVLAKDGGSTSVATQTTVDTPAVAETATPVKPKVTKAKVAEVVKDAVVEVTLEAVQGGLRAFVDKFGTQEAKDLLGKFSATRIGELKKEDYAGFVKAIQNKLDGK